VPKLQIRKVNVLQHCKSPTITWLATYSISSNRSYAMAKVWVCIFTTI